MASLAVTLNTAEQTLMNTQTELATSSNNISNASTAGYARQTAVQTENRQVLTTNGWMGSGASISTISQARDDYLEQQFMNATSSDSQYTTQTSQLTTIQTAAMDSGNSGISQALGNFFDSWSTLAQNPTAPAEQTAVYSAAQNLATSIQSTYGQLSNVNDQITSQVTNTVNQANTLLNQIAQLNQNIQASNATAQPNALLDQRYQSMDNLAKLIPVSFTTNSDGTVDVNTTENSSTVNLVSGRTVVGTVASDSGITGGQLGGLLQAQTNLSGYMSSFDDFAGTIAGQVNSVSGLNVFSGSNSSSIAANSGFLSGLTSDQLSSVTQSMANLQDSAVSFSDGTTGTPQQYLSNIQQTIGQDVQGANNNQTYYDALKSQLQTQQQSVSGVSVDEEMVNVIQYQQIYQAAAKVVQTVSNLMSTVINMVQ
ncbi:MAG: flagellar hook-associated protein FlgK [Syntrophobacteraceae bacterium]|nr:flagellar hook-associated protein FlgK [Syntrophobacteraceae bacterium]